MQIFCILFGDSIDFKTCALIGQIFKRRQIRAHFIPFKKINTKKSCTFKGVVELQLISQSCDGNKLILEIIFSRILLLYFRFQRCAFLQMQPISLPFSCLFSERFINGSLQGFPWGGKLKLCFRRVTSIRRVLHHFLKFSDDA